MIDGVDPVGLLTGSSQGLFERETTAISYSFSAPLPAGTVFVIDDPDSNIDYVGNSSVSSKLSARLGAASVASADWTVQDVFANPTSGSQTNATTLGTSGDVTLSGQFISEDILLPRPVALVTTTSPVDGIGANLVFLGSGASSVASAGADTVNGGAGSSTVSVTGANSDLAIDARGPLTFIAGTGASTVVAGEVAATLFGGAFGGTLAFGRGRTDYVGGGATDTVSALSGSLTARGGAGGGVFFGGTAGGNAITATAGDVAAQGGGAGDLLAATGAGDVLFSGGTGAETLTGAGSTGNNILLAGSGPEALVSGHGNTVQVAGASADSMTGDTGATLFLFIGGLTAGASDEITGFDPTHDFLRLLNYSGSTADVLRNASVGSGTSADSGNPYPTTTIALSDGTHVTFLGVQQLDAGSFI